MKKMKHFIKPIAASALLLLTAPCFADSNSDGASLIAYLSGLVSTTVNAAANLIYQFNPDMPTTVAANLGQVLGSESVSKTTNQLSLAMVQNGLTPQPSNSSLIQLASIPASDTLYVPSSVWSLSGNSNNPNLAAGNNNFSFATFFSPISYATGLQQMYASNYIKFLADEAQPISNLNIGGLSTDQLKQLQSETSFQNYQVSLRALIAQQSIAYSNLYHLYAERLPQQGLGTSVGMVDNQGNKITNASPLQVEQYIATRRADNPSWYQKMSTASSTTLLREIAMELAEIEKQQYQLHMDNERSLAAISTIELQSTFNEVSNVQEDITSLQNKINSLTGQASSSSANSNS